MIFFTSNAAYVNSLWDTVRNYIIVQLLYEDNSYYIVRVKDLSLNRDTLTFIFIKKETVDAVTSDSETDSTEKLDDRTLITTLCSDQRKTKSEQDYALLVNKLEKQFVKKKMKNYEKAIAYEGIMMTKMKELDVT